jgi:hypothetical protein
VRPADHVFEVDGDVVIPTELARGPWSPDAQHGGAPAALLAGLLERHDAGTATFPARFTVELLRPAPMTPLRVERRTIRPGKKVQLLQGSLFAGDVEVTRATLLRLREQTVDYTAELAGGPDVPIAPPGDVQPLMPQFARGAGFWSVMECSWVSGDWTQPGPTQLWMRLTTPIIAGEEPTPFQRVAAASDFGNGVAAAFDLRRYTAINPDLTITLHRLPVSEWVGLDSASYPETAGYGVAESVLHDERGRIGRAIQTVIVEPRPG